MHHIAIGTQDIQKLGEFYQKLPGVKLLKKNLTADGEVRSVWLRSGETVIMIERSEKPQAPKAVVFSLKESGLNREAIRSLDLNWIKSTEYTDYFTDPDGNTLGYSSFDFGIS